MLPHSACLTAACPAPKINTHPFAPLGFTHKLIYVAVQVSYVEIYNEAIKDLLVGSPAASTGKGPAAKIPAALEVRDKPNGEVYIDGAVEGTAGNVKEVAALLEAGNSARAVASHK